MLSVRIRPGLPSKGSVNMAKQKNVEAAGFYRGVKEELNNITWPTKPQVVNASTLILLLVVLVILFVAIVDYGLSKLTLLLTTL